MCHHYHFHSVSSEAILNAALYTLADDLKLSDAHYVLKCLLNDPITLGSSLKSFIKTEV